MFLKKKKIKEWELQQKSRIVRKSSFEWGKKYVIMVDKKREIRKAKK